MTNEEIFNYGRENKLTIGGITYQPKRNYVFFAPDVKYRLILSFTGKHQLVKVDDGVIREDISKDLLILYMKQFALLKKFSDEKKEILSIFNDKAKQKILLRKNKLKT